MEEKPFTKFEKEGNFRNSEGVHELDEIVELFPQEGTFIDFGCGDGAICIPLFKKGLEVYGIDTSEQGLIYANEYAKREGLKDKIVFELRSIYDLDGIGMFDYGLCSQVMEVLPNPKLALQLMISKIRKWLLVSFICGADMNEFTYQVWKTQDSIETFLRDCGIEKFDLVLNFHNVLYYKILREE